jgi:opacity protein-like surface antigen
MMSRINKNIAIIVICLMGSSVFCQETMLPPYSTQTHTSSEKLSFIELNFNLHIPLQQFGKNTNRDAMFGGEISFLRQLIADKPLFWGLRYNWSPYESADATISEILDFTQVDFDYHTYCNMQGIYGMARFYPKLSIWRVEPYINVIFGGKWLYSATTKTLIDSDESSDFYSESSDFSISYGAGIGLNISVSDNLYINISGEYIPGLQTQYLARKDDGEVDLSTVDLFAFKTSNTNIYTYSLGVTLLLND